METSIVKFESEYSVRTPSPNTTGLERLFSQVLTSLGEDPNRDGLRQTPARVARSLSFLTAGYWEDPGEVVNGAIFENDSDEMVIVRDIEFYSLCEHHLLPFFGKCHIGYLPAGKVIGLSKLARLVEVYCRRLQVQERMTLEIAKALGGLIPNHGVGVVVEAEHLCMKMRGVQKQSGDTVTSSLLGRFREDPRTRNEFMSLIRIR
ncbi:MAG TPA: GTP cyclohydrolase I FolE [Candidatus Kapabacteria bacterium]|jgi:GTP cyclohydrolase I|nr:GTP cyclohydrolase I FolE [Candidatus Kapabacteria bacterium]